MEREGLSFKTTGSCGDNGAVFRQNAASERGAVESSAKTDERPVVARRFHRDAAVRARAARIVVDIALKSAAHPDVVSDGTRPFGQVNHHAVLAYEGSLVVEEIAKAVGIALERDRINRPAVEVEHGRPCCLALNCGVVGTVDLVHDKRSAIVEVKMERVAACVHGTDVAAGGVERSAVVDCDRSASCRAVDGRSGKRRAAADCDVAADVERVNKHHIVGDGERIGN